MKRGRFGFLAVIWVYIVVLYLHINPRIGYNYNQPKSAVHSIDYWYLGFSTGTRLKASNTPGQFYRIRAMDFSIFYCVSVRGVN